MTEEDPLLRQRGVCLLLIVEPAGGLGQAEVHQLDAAFRRDHHVLRLDVAVDDAGTVREGERVGELHRDLEPLPDRQPSAFEPRCCQRSPSRPA